MMTEEEMKENELKWRAKNAVDTILAAEQFKKDKEIAKFVKAEMKERAKVLDSAMNTKKKEVVTKSKVAPKNNNNKKRK